MSGRKISIQAAVTAAFDFAKVTAPKTAGVLSIILLLNIASVFTPGTPLSASHLALMALEALFGVIAQGALYRLAFQNEHSGDPAFRVGPLGLQWGKPELRLLGADLLLLFLVVLALLFWVIILIVSLGAGMFVSGTGAAPLPPTPEQESHVLAAFAPLFLIALAVYVRICLYAAATVAERKVAVFSTWSLTRGKFWPILAAFVLLKIPIGALGLLAALAGEPHAATIVLELLACVLDAFLIRPMYCGLYAHLYSGLRTTSEVQTGGARGPWG
jgi:hypothetical protein